MSKRHYSIPATSPQEHVAKRIHEAEITNYKGIPAIVTNTDHYESLQSLDVEFLIKTRFTEKAGLTLSTVKLSKVFVKLPKFGGWDFKFPVNKGDKVWLTWSHLDLGEYLDGSGDTVTIDVSETSGIEDCVAELGFGTRRDHNNPSLENLIITQESTTLTVTPEGNVTLDTKGDIRTISEGSHYIKASHLTVDNDMTVTGNTLVKGTTTSEGLLTAKAGIHSSFYKGLSGGKAILPVDMEINGTVTINGTNVNTHTHTGDSGGDTGTMK